MTIMSVLLMTSQGVLTEQTNHKNKINLYIKMKVSEKYGLKCMKNSFIFFKKERKKETILKQMKRHSIFQVLHQN